MAIKNPYPDMEHRTFKRTFLQQAEVVVKFTPAIADEDFRALLIPYLKKVFNLDMSEWAEKEGNHAEITYEQEEKKFIFDTHQARVIIGPNVYKTFTESVIPLIGTLIRYVTDVAKIELIDELSVVKINIWPIKSDDAYSCFTDMIEYTFRENCVSDMLSYRFDEKPEPVRLSKTTNTHIADNVDLKMVLSAEVVSKEEGSMGLVLDATSKCVSVNDILSDAITLNEIIYHEFTSSVTDNIIYFMSRDNLS